MEELDAAMKAGTSLAVQYWMNWMLLIFASSLFFVWKDKPARVVLAAFILTMPIGFAIWSMTKNVHLLGIAHLLIWLPLLVYLYIKVIKTQEFELKSLYGVWLILLSSTILVSLVFDVRDVFLVLTGTK